MFRSIPRSLVLVFMLVFCGRLTAQDMFQPTTTQPPPQIQQTQETLPAQSQAQATQQDRPQLPQGFSYNQAATTGAKIVYTHYVGAFVVDTTSLFTTTHAIFRSQRQLPSGQPIPPMLAFDHRITYLGTYTFPYTGETGHLCLVIWTVQPQNQMPTFLFFTDHPHCDQYNVYSYRLNSNRWRYIGCFVRAPLGQP
jgi:hypothetical protein